MTVQKTAAPRSSEILVPKQKLKNPPLSLNYMGDRVLRQPAKRISSVNPETRQLIRQMLQTMYSEDGIGLAAPQVGISKRLLVVDCDPENAAAPPLVLINPEIKSVSQDIALGQEGCLSIPSVFLDVKRPEQITVSYRDEQGRPQSLTTAGLVARCIQHEIDHLDGILFVDRVENSILLAQELAKNGFAQRDVKPLPR
ncbi:peptide deformylase [Leptolyngbya sp. FACHB-261]|uniref:peptide deformylase n=1 Tax=Leptolyngbya sp. FACHB-261 TaxID=2692806 RepID=UPI001689CADF|nr:peptide deformylase [Leptolyngbya sp. FACHB-261]MBD2100747.1 peptide deformylase [Leptolyngbya sp. FACHB-261]